MDCVKINLEEIVRENVEQFKLVQGSMKLHTFVKTALKFELHKTYGISSRALIFSDFQGLYALDPVQSLFYMKLKH
jgi:hypothetical protein